jgi:hypothetical protein
MRLWQLGWGALVVSLACTGCDTDTALQKFASPADQATAIAQIELLRTHQYDEIEKRLGPGAEGPNLRATLEQMAAVFGDAEPTAKKLVGAYQNYVNGQHTVSLTYQYQVGARYLYARCDFARQDDRVVILGLEVRPLAASLESISRLDFHDKPLRNYLIVGATLLAATVSFVALFVCIFERGLRRKWAWVLFIILGVTQTRLDWNSGAVDFSAPHLLLFSAGYDHSLYSPWVFSVAVPVGAVAYLVRRLLNSRRPQESKTSEPGAGETA